jgi:hypothetical protein
MAREPRIVEVENPEVFSSQYRKLAMIGERILEDESMVELVK